jgi:hypothetical protein
MWRPLSSNVLKPKSKKRTGNVKPKLKPNLKPKPKRKYIKEKQTQRK